MVPRQEEAGGPGRLAKTQEEPAGRGSKGQFDELGLVDQAPSGQLQYGEVTATTPATDGQLQGATGAHSCRILPAEVRQPLSAPVALPICGKHLPCHRVVTDARWGLEEPRRHFESGRVWLGHLQGRPVLRTRRFLAQKCSRGESPSASVARGSGTTARAGAGGHRGRALEGQGDQQGVRGRP